MDGWRRRWCRDRLLLVPTLGQTPIGNVDVGTINGAPYRIEMPAQWNKGLIMYAHGYQPADAKPDFDNARNPPFRRIFLSRLPRSPATPYTWAKEGKKPAPGEQK